MAQKLAGASDVESGDMEQEEVPEVKSWVTVRRAGRGKYISEVSSEATPSNKQHRVHAKGRTISGQATLEQVTTPSARASKGPASRVDVMKA